MTAEDRIIDKLYVMSSTVLQSVALYPTEDKFVKRFHKALIKYMSGEMDQIQKLMKRNKYGTSDKQDY